MAVFAVLGWARMEVMKSSDNMTIDRSIDLVDVMIFGDSIWVLTFDLDIDFV